MNYSIEVMRTQLVRGIGNIAGYCGSRVQESGYPEGGRKEWMEKLMPGCLSSACRQFYQTSDDVESVLVVKDYPYLNGGEVVLHLRVEGKDDTFKVTIPYSQIDHWCLA
jgi:hypothetical protein